MAQKILLQISVEPGKGILVGGGWIPLGGTLEDAEKALGNQESCVGGLPSWYGGNITMDFGTQGQLECIRILGGTYNGLTIDPAIASCHLFNARCSQVVRSLRRSVGLRTGVAPEVAVSARENAQGLVYIFPGEGLTLWRDLSCRPDILDGLSAPVNVSDMGGSAEPAYREIAWLDSYTGVEIATEKYTRVHMNEASAKAKTSRKRPTDAALVSMAFEALKNAYVPYSKFPVGAALLCEDGSIYTGCNVENAAYGSTLCAERGALMNAVSNGHTSGFVALAIAGNSTDYCWPCGSCRQMLYEFAPNLTVLVARRDRNFVTIPLSDLLPHGFGPVSLNS